MSRRKKVCILGGGNCCHVLAGVLGSDFDVTLLTRKPEKWTKEIEVIFKDENNRSVFGKIQAVSSDPRDVCPDTDIFICGGPCHINPIYLSKIKDFVKDGCVIGNIFGQGGFDYAVLDLLGGLNELRKRNIMCYSLKGIPWVCRTKEYGKSVFVVGTKKRVQCAVLPNEQSEECSKIVSLVSCGLRVEVLPTNLVVLLVPGNQIIHSGRYYGLFKDWDGVKTWSTEEVPFMYEDFDDISALTTSGLSDEIQMIKKKIVELYPEIDLGEVEPIRETIISAYKELVTDQRTVKSVFCTNKAYAGIKTPMEEIEEGKFIPALKSRVFWEDIPYGLVCVKCVAELLELKTPTIDTCIQWAQKLMKKNFLLEDNSINRDPEVLKQTGCPYRFGIKTVGELVESSLKKKDDIRDI